MSALWWVLTPIDLPVQLLVYKHCLSLSKVSLFSLLLINVFTHVFVSTQKHSFLKEFAVVIII